MRLTLRNLLRFLDQSDLRSIERSRLEELVDKSEKADAWIKRIDGLRRNRAIESPAVQTDNPSINRVAEYLDSGMSEEQTIQFEKSLLGSDPLLAEVACCHEICELLRTDVRPKVPIILRQTIYDLDRNGLNYEYEDPEESVDDATEAAGDEKVAGIVANMEDLPFVDSGPEEPEPIGGPSNELGDEADDAEEGETVSLDDLTKKATSQRRLLTTCLVGVMVGLLGLTYWLGLKAGQHPRIIGAATEAAENADKERRDKENAAFRDGRRKVAGDGEQQASQKGGQPNVDQSDDVASQNPNDQARNRPGQGSENPAGENVTTDFGPKLPIPTLVLPDDEEPKEENALALRPNIFWTAPGVAEAEVVEVPRLEVARQTNAEELLFTRDGDNGPWIRPPADSAIVETTKVLVLAGSSIQFNLSAGKTLQVTGPAEFAFGRREKASETDVVQVKYGEFLLKATETDTSLMFENQERLYRVEMPVQNTTVKIRFDRFQLPGVDVRSSESASVDFFSVLSERIVLSMDGKSHRIESGHGLAASFSDDTSLVRDTASGLLSGEIPESPWYVTRLVNVVERNFPEHLDDNQTLDEQLVDWKGDNKQEIRFAALAWLASIGNYSYVVDFLNEESNRNNWRSLMEAIRASITNQPDFANNLYADLAVAGVADQQKLYKLIIGMSSEQLKAGGDVELVDLLDDKTLGIRVAAIECLRQITGGLTYSFKPNEERLLRRKTIERKWKKELMREKIRYSEEPSLPFPTFSTVPLIPSTDQDSDKSGS